MVVMDAVADDHVDTKIWLLNTGYPNHMTGRKVWLVYFDELKKSKVKLVYNSSLQVEGTLCTWNKVQLSKCWTTSRKMFLSGYKIWSLGTVRRP